MPWKQRTAPFIPCVHSLGKRATCLLVLLVLPFCVWSSPAAAQQAATTTNTLDQPTADLNASVQPTTKVPDVPATFKHPGLLNSMEELQFIKQKIQAGEEPWKSAFEQMKAIKYASLTYKPHPHETASSGFLGKGGGPGGAWDENNDAIAAYTQALMWIFTDNEQYAQNAVDILNAWSILQTHGGPNWYLETAWEGSMWAEGAELIRATYPKWNPDDIAKFSAMLDRAFLPLLHNQLSYGNRELAVCNAMVTIGVFNNDRAAFAEGINHWVSYVPCWIYLTDDGPTPKKPDYWLTSPSNDDLAQMDAGLFPDVKQSWIYTDLDAYMKANKLGNDHGMVQKGDLPGLWYHAPQAAYVDGLCSETFRDLGHCDLGFCQMINTAEIAWHQGIDLYGMQAKRITAFMELESSLHNTDDPLPDAFAKVNPGVSGTFEIAYNHYHNRMGMDLPKTQALIQLYRPLLQQVPSVSAGWCVLKAEPGLRTKDIPGPAVLDIAWESLTHAELNAKGNLPAGNGAVAGTTSTGVGHP
ncbi:MAG: alginate lyase family protein [Methylacidiphilales bacterium]|nr:alginate lyase family protein [Candidatus Methylacidiphilales bacterium]